MEELQWQEITFFPPLFPSVIAYLKLLNSKPRIASAWKSFLTAYVSQVTWGKSFPGTKQRGPEVGGEAASAGVMSLHAA